MKKSGLQIDRVNDREKSIRSVQANFQRTSIQTQKILLAIGINTQIGTNEPNDASAIAIENARNGTVACYCGPFDTASAFGVSVPGTGWHVPGGLGVLRRAYEPKYTDPVLIV